MTKQNTSFEVERHLNLNFLMFGQAKFRPVQWKNILV